MMAFRPKHNSIFSNSSSSSITASSFQLSTFSPSVSTPSHVFQYASSNASSSSLTAPSPAASSYASKRRILPYRNEHGHGWARIWLDAMKSSSPPHARPMKVNELDRLSNDFLDLQYRAWTADHPSALATFDQLFEAAYGKQVAVFLDYDGTLSPIVQDPDSAFMSDAMRATVKEVATHFPTAIISGRSRDKVYEFVKLPELYYAGSHGMDIMGPMEGHKDVKACGPIEAESEGNRVVLFQPPNDFVVVIDEVCKTLEESTKQIDGAKIENNKFCATIHFRCVKEEYWSILAKQVQDVLRSYPNLSLTHGRKVLEIRPSIEWNKGKALIFLLETLGLGTHENFFPVYIGDDKTDEDAFKVLNKGPGLSIIVSSIAKETSAISSLRDPAEVMKFLGCLLHWKKTSQ